MSVSPTSPTAPVQSIKNSGFDNSVAAVLLIAVSLAAVVVAVFYLWRQVAPGAPLASERYFPAVHGASLSYRISNPDNSISYRSRNIYRDNANALAAKLDSNSFGALLTATGIDVTNTPAELMLRQLDQIDILQFTDVESDAQGNPIRQSQLLALVRDHAIQQFAVDEIGIEPPIPLIPNEPNTVEGMLNASIPFQVSQEIQERGPHPTAIGDLDDCIRVHTELTIGEQVTTSNTWYCAGVGEVADETTDANGTRRTEVVAASVGSFLRGSAPFLPNSSVNAAIQRVFPNVLQGKIVPGLIYKEDGESRGITTNILPLDGTLLYGTNSGALVALDRAGESELWRFQTGDSIFGTPVVANGVVLFGSADKKFYAVRLSDGAFLWAFQMKDLVSGSPAVSGDTVFVASEDRHVYALDADTGRLRWQFTSGSPFVASPVLSGEHIIVSNDDGGVYALDAVTGNSVWDFAASSAVTGAATVVDDVVYFGSFDQSVYALDAKTGELRWSQFVGDNVREPVVVSDARVYVTLSEEVLALDTADGSKLWRFGNGRSIFGAPVLMGNQLWTLQSGNLFALNAATGEVLQQVPTTDASVFKGISSNGQEIFVGFFDGQLMSWTGVTE